MVPSFIILFREILEIAIILSIVLAGTRGVTGRGFYVWMGVLGGIVGSALVAFFAGEITDALEGMGQEVFNGVVLLVAAAMIGWTVIWMQTHGKEIANRMRHLGVGVHEGRIPLYSVSIVVALAMWREGAEIALFMTGIIATRTESLASIMAGAVTGGVAAAIIGALIYFGLIKISNKYLFKVTGCMLILLASGMAAAGAGFLVAADMLPALSHQLWDSSHILSESSIAGKILHAMLGYSEQPSGIQLVFYLGTLSLILLILKLKKKPV